MCSNTNNDMLKDTNSPSGDRHSIIISALTAHHAGIWEWDSSTDELVFVNDFLKQLGLEEMDIEFHTLSQLREYVHPEDLPLFTKAFSTVQDTAGKKSVVTYRFVGKNGKTKWVKDHFYSTLDAKGETLSVICYTTLAEHEKKQEQTIKETNDKYWKIVNTLPDFIFVFDENFVFQDIIMAETMSLLHTREELIGSSGRKIFTPEICELYENNIRECLRTKQLREVEYYLLIGEAKYHFQARIVPFEGNKVFALIRDITNRVRRMEGLLAAKKRAEEAERMKSEFLANMSHEIRTPLNAIIGFTEIVAAEEDPEARAEYMDIIQHNNHLLLHLINDLLDLSRIESGKSKMTFESTDIRNLIDEIETTHKYKMKPGVEFKLDLPQEEQLWAYTDRTRITQILFNLISNSIKNTEKGSVTLKVEVIDPFIKFSVSDTGIGIPEDRVASIFDRFEKVADKSQGTGLGLSICKSLVERLGGSISAESVLGQGSTFSFTIPYQNAPHFASISEEQLEDEPSSRKKILVAEESKENFDYIKKVLEKAYDVELIWASNGEEAITQFVVESPNLVLMSIQLPILSGLDATKRIRNISRTVPVIGITNDAFYMEQQWALESGCNDTLTRPYTVTKLEEIVLAFL